MEERPRSSVIQTYVLYSNSISPLRKDAASLRQRHDNLRGIDIILSATSSRVMCGCQERRFASVPSSHEAKGYIHRVVLGFREAAFGSCRVRKRPEGGI